MNNNNVNSIAQCHRQIKNKKYSALKIVSIVVLTIMCGGLVTAQSATNPGPLGNITSAGNATLDANPSLLANAQLPTGLGKFVQDQAALLRLGKSLFWDMQVGSDGVQSCASCHFHAGADNRIKNQVAPGLLANPRDTTFQLGGAPNYTLKATDFPLSIDSDRNDVVSSQGVFSGDVTDPDGFHVAGVKVRRVEPRNAPTVFNTAFNRHQFWDGRAKDQFNGVSPFGANPATYPVVYRALTKQGAWDAYDIVQNGDLNNASLASIAVGPVTSLFEMTSTERLFPDVQLTFKNKGHKLKSVRPLAKQIVDVTDSVLGESSRYPKPGLSTKDYAQMVEQAFQPQWWDSNQKQNGYTLMEQNFSLFWGLALREYMATLSADAGLQAHTPFDRYQAGDESALTTQEINGLKLFTSTVAQGGANCNTCHVIPEFTRASIRRTLAQQQLTGLAFDTTVAANGFHTDYGVRRPGDDPGAGASGTFPTPAAGTTAADTRPNTFKAPTLRNIGLTAPYMHTGRFSLLEQVVQFYNDGRFDGVANRGPLLGLTAENQADLVAFLRCGLTDDRVNHEQAPFDHPQLFIPNGHPGDQFMVTLSDNGNATDELMEIPAVGRNGVSAPISEQNFEVKLGFTQGACAPRP